MGTPPTAHGSAANGGRHLDRQVLVTSPHGELERLLGRQIGERVTGGVAAHHRRLVDLEDHVVLLAPGRRREEILDGGSGSRRMKPNSAATRSPAMVRGIEMSRTGKVRRPSGRRTVSWASRSTGPEAIMRWSRRVSVTGRPSTATTTSPLLRPARWAGVSSITSTITTP